MLELVDLVTNGGEIGVFGRTGDALGLKRSRMLVTDLQAQLRADGEAATAAELDPLVNFIDETQRNLDLAQARRERDPGPDRAGGHRGRDGPRAAVGLRLRRAPCS